MRRRARRQNRIELDLHGVIHAEVEHKVEDFVLEHQCEMFIITGHSEEMKRIVADVLDKHDFIYNIGMPGNPGIIHISS